LLAISHLIFQFRQRRANQFPVHVLLLTKQGRLGARGP
jgi:hypothetical protein